MQGQGPSNINLSLFVLASLILNDLPNHFPLLTMFKPIYFLHKICLFGLKQKYILVTENVSDKLQQMKSEMKDMKERLDTLTASLEENKDEGQL